MPPPSVPADQRHLLPPCTPCTIFYPSPAKRLETTRLFEAWVSGYESALECFRTGDPPGQHSHLRHCLLAAVGKAIPMMLQGLHARWQTALAWRLPADACLLHHAVHVSVHPACCSTACMPLAGHPDLGSACLPLLFLRNAMLRRSAHICEQSGMEWQAQPQTLRASKAPLQPV